MSAKTVKAIRKASKIIGNSTSMFNRSKAFYNGLSAFEKKEFMRMTKLLIESGRKNAIS